MVHKQTREEVVAPSETADPEPRWPALLALLAVAALNWMLPPELSGGPGWLTVAAIGVLAILAHLLHRWHDVIGYVAAGIATLSLAYAVIALVRALASHQGQPKQLLAGALLIWTMNVFVFASWYWRLDAGGPHCRTHQRVYCGGAFLFPQLTLPAEARKAIGAEDWRPRFIDYLFVAFNASTAFSPTDVPVLSPWAKVLMMTQSSISLTTLAIVAARAVNIL